MPGLFVVAGRPEEIMPARDLVGCMPDEFSLHELKGCHWLSAAVCTRLTKDASFGQSEDGKIQVLFDGYLTDIVDIAVVGDWRRQPAASILDLYRRYGVSFLLNLRGAFAFLIVDQRAKKAFLASDRKGSRPSFYNQEKGCLRVATTVYSLAKHAQTCLSLDNASVVEFLLTGAFRDKYTLFDDIYRMPKASVMSVDDKGHVETRRYWRLKFEPHTTDENALVAQCNEVLEQAAQRAVDTMPDAALALSGGLDSRVVLGYLREVKGGDVPVVCFWERGTQGDDSKVAGQLADMLNLPKYTYEFDMKDFVSTADYATLSADCSVEVIDSAPLTLLWERLRGLFPAFINGDECFGWHGLVSSKQAAFSEIRWYRLSQAARVSDWINPRIKKDLAKIIDARLVDLEHECSSNRPNDLKDWLYYEERLEKMLNAFVASKLRSLEILRPLVDEDVIDFISTVPEKWRDDKKLLRVLFKKRFPELNAIPFAKRDVLPQVDGFHERLKNDPEWQKFFIDHLIEGLPQPLRDLLDVKQFNRSLFALAKGSSLPPLKHSLIERIPGMWRFRKPPENRVAPMVAMLRLLQLSIYLRYLGKV